MAAPGPGSALLFLASDSRVAGERSYYRGVFQGPASRLFVPASVASWTTNPALANPSADPNIGFPRDQLVCAQIVLDEAKRLNKQVRIVDVSRPGGDRALVERFAVQDRVLPILVRPDGRSLEGEESFTPKGVRAFLSGA